MEWGNILLTAGSLGVIALVCGVALAWVASKFGVAENEAVIALNEALPGVNCGGCGYPGCSEYAKAIVEREVPLNLCAPGGPETAARLGALTGRSVEASEPLMAVIHCSGDLDDAKRHFAYNNLCHVFLVY